MNEKRPLGFVQARAAVVAQAAARVVAVVAVSRLSSSGVASGAVARVQPSRLMRLAVRGSDRAQAASVAAAVQPVVDAGFDYWMVVSGGAVGMAGVLEEPVVVIQAGGSAA